MNFQGFLYFILLYCGLKCFGSFEIYQIMTIVYRQKHVLSERCLSYEEMGLFIKSRSSLHSKICKTEILLDWFVWKYAERFYAQGTNIKCSKFKVILKNKWNLFLVYFSFMCIHLITNFFIICEFGYKHMKRLLNSSVFPNIVCAWNFKL